MILSEFESKKIEQQLESFLEERRPPPQIRPEFDLGFRVSGQSIEIFGIRPLWDNPKEKIEEPVAKATYVKDTEGLEGVLAKSRSEVESVRSGSRG